MIKIHQMDTNRSDHTHQHMLNILRNHFKHLIMVGIGGSEPVTLLQFAGMMSKCIRLLSGGQWRMNWKNGSINEAAQ